jgi:DNA polymerase I
MRLVVNDSNYHQIVKKLISTDTKAVTKGSNLQNLPSKGDGTKVRNCFRPRKGWVFAAADLSQIEPRIQAHIMYVRYGDNSLRQIFLDGRDLYTTMSMLVFGLPEAYCVDKAWYDPKTKTGGYGGDAPPTAFYPRKMMKAGVLAKSYGQTPKAFARNMGVSMDVAEMFFEKFDTSFPSFVTMVRDIQNFMKQNGYVETLYGRKRRFPEYKIVAREVLKNEAKLSQLYQERSKIQKKLVKTARDLEKLKEIEAMIQPLAEKKGLVGYWERAAFNAVIQGTGADILKMNMIRLAEVCDERGWELNASIHDEVKISLPVRELTPEVPALVTEIMTQTAKLSLPLKSDTVIETMWLAEYAPDEWDYENYRPKKFKYGEESWWLEHIAA